VSSVILLSQNDVVLDVIQSCDKRYCSTEADINSKKVASDTAARMLFVLIQMIQYLWKRQVNWLSVDTKSINKAAQHDYRA